MKGISATRSASVVARTRSRSRLSPASVMTALPAALRHLLSIAGAAALLAPARAALAEPPPESTPSGIHPTLLWTALQLVPSPEWRNDGSRSYAGMRWQVTPLLYSFGINRKLSPWRTLIAEPTVRHS